MDRWSYRFQVDGRIYLLRSLLQVFSFSQNNSFARQKNTKEEIINLKYTRMVLWKIGQFFSTWAGRVFCRERGNEARKETTCTWNFLSPTLTWCLIGQEMKKKTSKTNTCIENVKSQSKFARVAIKSFKLPKFLSQVNSVPFSVVLIDSSIKFSMYV